VADPVGGRQYTFVARAQSVKAAYTFSFDVLFMVRARVSERVSSF